MDPLRFPTARQLRDAIWNELGTNSSQMLTSLRDCGFQDALLHDFRYHLGASQQSSVDAFLEYRREFIDVGKAAIAAALIRIESEARLVRPELEDTWYGYLFRELRATKDEFAANRLRIATFNYDRSLEHYLFLGLRSSFGLSEEAAADLVRQVPVFHAYGDLGALPYLAKDEVRPYDTTVNADAIRTAASRITIVSQKDWVVPLFNPEHPLLSEAEVLCFLGFGYHPDNLRRLGLDQLNRAAGVFGSALGLTAHERSRVKGLFRKLGLAPIADRIHFGETAADAYTCIRTFPVFV